MQRLSFAVMAAALSVLLLLAFNQPVSWAALAAPASWQLPLEPIVGLVLLCLLPSRGWSLVIAVLLGAMLWLRLSDRLVLDWMGRPFTALFDIPLGLSLLEIGIAALGWPLTMALAVAACALLPLGIGLAWLWQRQLLQAPRPLVIGLAVLTAALAGLGRLEAMPALTSTHGIEQLRQQVERSFAMLEARQRWQAAAALDPIRDIPEEQLFARLANTDVLVLWIESYGRSALTRQPFAPAITGRLAAFEADLADRGLHAVSGWLTSPTVGGQSWLAHATLASGVWTSDQPSHRQYLQDAKADIAHLFRARGHRTVLGMPAIVRALPEVVNLGFDRWYFADHFDYRGPPLEWVTMPDQFTLWALENAERALPLNERRPVYLQVALISSHAPFTPDIPVVEPWELMGDGSIVHELPKDGGAPRDVWRDHDALLAAYTRSIDYTLATLQSHARRYGNAGTLTLLIGDHEPASRISGTQDERAVPIHVVSGDSELLEPFLDWGFTPGMLPGPTTAEHPMDAFRSFFAHAFSRRAPSPPGEG